MINDFTEPPPDLPVDHPDWPAKYSDWWFRKCQYYGIDPADAMLRALEVKDEPTKAGQVVVDAVIRAGAIVDAEKVGDACIFIWSANCEEQIEAALDEAGYKIVRKDE